MPNLLTKLQTARTALENDELEVAARRLNDIFLEAIKDQDYPNAVHAKADESSALRHLYERDHDIAYAHAALLVAELGLKLANEYNLSGKLGVAHFRMATSLMLLQRYGEAVNHFEFALGHFEDSPAEKLNWEIHLHEALFWSGNIGVKAESAIDDCITQLLRRSAEVDPYTLAVWISGGNLAIARLQFRYNLPSQARMNVNQAMRRIEENDAVPGRQKMIIRRRQAEKLLSRFDGRFSKL